MSANNSEDRGTWSGQMAFVLAASGSAVGLGNMWKFPYITGVNGGGAFVLVYLLCIALIGLPLLTAEMMLGRRSRKDAVGAYLGLTNPKRGGKIWAVFGFLAVAVGFILLSYYSVVGGWTLAYTVKAITGGLHPADGEASGAIFGALVNSNQAVLFHGIFMALCIGIVGGGVRSGIERAARILMPLLALFLLVILVKSLTMPGARQALEFMFYPDFSKLTGASVLEALGHSLFTLSVGMGAMIAYGSYIKSDQSIFKAALIVGFLDTAIAIIAGVTIFGIVFSFGMEPGQGAGLIFVTMPVLFAQMPGGAFFATLLFLLLAFAAVTSGISILEVVVAYFVDELGMKRRLASLLFGGAIFLIGVKSAMDDAFLDKLDHLVSNWLLAIGGLGVAVFTGWVVSRKDLEDEVEGESLAGVMFGFWLLCTRVVVPIGIVIVVLHNVGVL